jgi:hypothetical protein
MIFEIEKFYQHNSGQMMYICNEIHTHMYGRCLIAETSDNGFKAIDKYGTDNWLEIPKEKFLLKSFDHDISTTEKLKEKLKVKERKIKISKINNE